MMEEQTFLLEIQSRSLLELKKYRGNKELDVTLRNINSTVKFHCSHTNIVVTDKNLDKINSIYLCQTAKATYDQGKAKSRGYFCYPWQVYPQDFRTRKRQQKQNFSFPGMVTSSL